MITRHQLQEMKALWEADSLGSSATLEGIQQQVLGLIEEIKTCWAALKRIHQLANSILPASSRPDIAWVERHAPDECRE